MILILMNFLNGNKNPVVQNVVTMFFVVAVALHTKNPKILIVKDGENF